MSVFVLCVCVSVCDVWEWLSGGWLWCGCGFFVGHVSVSAACSVRWGESGRQAGGQAARALPLHTMAGLTAGRRRKLDVREISQRQIDSL